MNKSALHMKPIKTTSHLNNIFGFELLTNLFYRTVPAHEFVFIFVPLFMKLACELNNDNKNNLCVSVQIILQTRLIYKVILALCRTNYK